MNSKPPEVVERFIELRAQGWPFARIVSELAVGKTTLIIWSRKYYHRIQNLRALAVESLTQDCEISRPQCVQNLGDDIRRIRDEIAKRDLSDIPTAKLFALAALLRSEANRLNGPLQLAEPLSLTPLEDQDIDPVLSWES